MADMSKVKLPDNSVYNLRDDRFIYEKSVSASNVATFSDGADNVPLKSLTLDINPVQSLNGYDKPWAGGAGKNKFDKGAVSSISDYTDIANGYYYTDIITLKPNTDYVMSPTSTTALSTTGYYVLYINPDASDPDYLVITNQNIRYPVQGGVPTTVTFTTGATGTIRFGVISLSNVPKESDLTAFMSINYQIEAGSTATTWQPYENICPISGWNECNVHHVGKNIADANNFLKPNNWAYDTTDNAYYGNITDLHGYYQPQTYSHWFLPNGSYGQVTISLKYKCTESTDTRNRCSITFYYTDGTTGSNQCGYSTTYVDKVFTSNASKSVQTIRFGYNAGGTIYLKDFMIETGNTATAYEPYIGNAYYYNMFWSNQAVTANGSLSTATNRILSENTYLKKGTYKFYSTIPSFQIHFRAYNAQSRSSGTYDSSQSVVVWNDANGCEFVLNNDSFVSVVGRYSNDSDISRDVTQNVFYAYNKAGNQEIYPIQFGDTYYGCTIDETGKLKMKYVKSVIDKTVFRDYGTANDAMWFEVNMNRFSMRNLFYGAQAVGNYYNRSRKSKGFYCKSNVFNVLAFNDVNYVSTQYRTYMTLPNGVTNYASWQAFMQKLIDDNVEVYFIYEFSQGSPIEFQLTSEQIKTFKGSNSFWHDANGTTACTYRVNTPLVDAIKDISPEVTIDDTKTVTNQTWSSSKIASEISSATADVIDDTTTDTDTTWSSSKISTELATKTEVDDTTASATKTYSSNKIEDIIEAITPRTGTVTDQAVASFSDGANDIPLKELSLSINPTQSGSGDPAPDNIRPITGVSSVNVTRTGKNIIPNNAITHPVPNNLYAWRDRIGTTLKAGTYTVSCSVYVSGIYVNQYGGGGTIFTKYNSTFLTFTLNEDTSGINFNLYLANGDLTNAKIQLEVGNSATDIEPYKGNTYLIQLGDTYYGATLDVVRGKLVCNTGFISWNGSDNWSSDTQSGNPVMKIARPSGIKISDMMICSHAVRTSNSSQIYSGYYFVGNSNILFGYSGTLAEWQTLLNSDNLQIRYELATPIEIDLTPTQINSLLGSNNIWHDGNGNTSCEYYKTGCEPIARLIESYTDKPTFFNGTLFN